MSTPDHSPSDQFVRDLTGAQTRLLAFVLTLLPEIQGAQDVLQNANVVLWRKAAEFRPGTSFMAWACEVCRREVQAYLRDQGRDRHVFDAAFLEGVAESAQRQSEQSSRLGVYLDECLALRPTEERQLLRERYSAGASVKELSQRMGVDPGTLSKRICRICDTVLSCIQRKTAAERSQ